MEEKILETARGFAAHMQEVLGENLLAVVLYGSAVREEYVAGRSDLNFALFLSRIDGPVLNRLIQPLRGWRKRGVSLPFFLTPADLEHSRDSFPVEFLEMKRTGRLMAGQDLLSGLTIAAEHLRLQCEREIKGKILQLRRAYLERAGRVRELDFLFQESAKSFLVLLRSILWLTEGEKGAVKGLEVIGAAEKKLGREFPHFRRVWAFRSGKFKLSSEEASRLFDGYLAEAEVLCGWIDRWSRESGKEE